MTELKFNFVGSKLRLISALYPANSKDIIVKIDGVVVDKLSLYSSGEHLAPLLWYEKTGLENKEHYIENKIHI